MTPATRSASARGGNALDAGDQLLRRLRQEFEDLERALLQLHEARLDLLAHGLGFFDPPDARHHEGVALEILDHAEALLPLANHVMRAVGRSDVAHDARDRADEAKVLRPGLLGFRVPLRQDADRLLRLGRGLSRCDRGLAAQRDRQDHAGEKHHPAHRQDDDRIIGKSVGALRGRRAAAPALSPADF